MCNKLSWVSHLLFISLLKLDDQRDIFGKQFISYLHMVFVWFQYCPNWKLYSQNRFCYLYLSLCLEKHTYLSRKKSHILLIRCGTSHRGSHKQLKVHLPKIYLACNYRTINCSSVFSHLCTTLERWHFLVLLQFDE